MTLTEARKLARQARRYGYQHNTDPRAAYALSVKCPVCKAKVEADPAYHWRPARKGEGWSQVIDGKRSVFECESVTQALDRAVITHLLNECEGPRNG